jgi:hypothetical protein
LIAQLSSNKKYNREQDTVNWYGFYKMVLEHCGWAIQSFQFQPYTVAGPTLSIDKAITDILSKIASGNEMAAVQAMIDSLKAMGGSDPRFTLFSVSSRAASGGNFQISNATESGGQLAMKIASFYYTCTEDRVDFLWFHFDTGKMQVFDASQTMTLDDNVYSQVRQTIVAKLGKAAADFIADLNI